MPAFPTIDRRFVWIALGLGAIILNALLAWNPQFTEIFYSRGLFVLFRWIWDYTLGLLPIPLMYLGILGLSVWLFFRIKNSHTKRKIQKRQHRFGGRILSLLAIGMGAIFFFQFLWGFNYNRVSVERQLELPKMNLDSTQIHEELLAVTETIIDLRKNIPGSDTATLPVHTLPEELEVKMRGHLSQVLGIWGYPTPGRVRCRQIYPKGSLMRMGASGIYLPFIGEGSVDAALPVFSKPEVLAHEMSHAYGFGDEGTANFWAYLACIQSDDPMIRYSGEFAYWRQLARQFIRISPEAYQSFRETLPEGIKADLRELRHVYTQYPAFFPILFEKVYNRYLKTQGIPDGTMSYSRVVQMVMAWKEKERLN